MVPVLNKFFSPPFSVQYSRLQNRGYIFAFEAGEHEARGERGERVKRDGIRKRKNNVACDSRSALTSRFNSPPLVWKRKKIAPVLQAINVDTKKMSTENS